MASYAVTLKNALEAEGIATTNADGSKMSQDDMIAAFVAKHEKNKGKAKLSDASASAARKMKGPKLSVDSSGLSKKDFFNARRSEVKKSCKSAKDIRTTLQKMWDDHVASDKKKSPKKEAATPDKKPAYHSFDEELDAAFAAQQGLKKIGLMGEKHVYVSSTPSSSGKSPASALAISDAGVGSNQQPSMKAESKKRKETETKKEWKHITNATKEILTTWLFHLDQNVLKEMTKQYGKATSGNKKTLIDRLMESVRSVEEDPDTAFTKSKRVKKEMLEPNDDAKVKKEEKEDDAEDDEEDSDDEVEEVEEVEDDEEDEDDEEEEDDDEEEDDEEDEDEEDDEEDED